MSVSVKRAVQFVRKAGIVRPRELASLGISRAALAELVTAGVVRRDGRGLYSATNTGMSEHRSLAEVAKRIPLGVICLLSALRFHGLTVQNPHEIWVAIRGKTWRSVFDYPPVRIFEFTGKAWTEGIESHRIDGVAVRVTSISKTIADCFKFRNQIGLDVALEALNDAWQQKKLDTDELWHYAQVCRVLKIVRPYLDTLK